MIFFCDYTFGVPTYSSAIAIMPGKICWTLYFFSIRHGICNKSEDRKNDALLFSVNINSNDSLIEEDPHPSCFIWFVKNYYLIPLLYTIPGYPLDIT